MNRNGQAYSTFKLLIAAIVAMAILAILLPIILKAINVFQPHPTTEVTTVLNELVERPGTLRHTNEVVFQSDDSIAGASLANKLSISKNQICMSKGDFKDDEDFKLLEGDNEHRIQYTGTSPRTVRMALICNVDQEALEEDFDFYDEEVGDYEIDCEVCGENSKCCALYLRKV